MFNLAYVHAFFIIVGQRCPVFVKEKLTTLPVIGLEIADSTKDDVIMKEVITT